MNLNLAEFLLTVDSYWADLQDRHDELWRRGAAPLTAVERAVWRADCIDMAVRWIGIGSVLSTPVEDVVDTLIHGDLG